MTIDTSNHQRCGWAESDPLMRTYHDERMGRARARLPSAVGEADARRLPGGARLDHRAAQARGVPRRLRGLRSRSRGALRRGGHRAAAGRCRHHPIPRQDRGDDRRRPRFPRDARRGRGFLRLLLVLHQRRAAGRRRPSPSAQRRPCRKPISKALKARGFKFVGPTIVYAWMQATGIVNDHAATCFRRGDVAGSKPSRRSG